MKLPKEHICGTAKKMTGLPTCITNERTALRRRNSGISSTSLGRLLLHIEYRRYIYTHYQATPRAAQPAKLGIKKNTGM